MILVLVFVGGNITGRRMRDEQTIIVVDIINSRCLGGRKHIVLLQSSAAKPTSIITKPRDVGRQSWEITGTKERKLCGARTHIHTYMLKHLMIV